MSRRESAADGALTDQRAKPFLLGRVGYRAAAAAVFATSPWAGDGPVLGRLDIFWA